MLSSIEEVKSKMEGIFYTKKGPSLEQLKKSCGVKRIQDVDGERWEVGIVLEMRCPESLEVLYPFFESDPPIPLILLYDHNFMEHNREGDLHAVLIDSINYEKEKIFVINPTKKDLKEPFPYDFNRFRLAWQKSQHATLLAYSPSKLQVIEGKEVKMWKQTTLGV